MLLNSFQYFIFLFAVFLIYYAVNNKLRWIVLAIASLFFIGSIAPNLVVFTLIFTTVNYFLGIALQDNRDKSYRTWIFWIAVAFDIGTLAFYKYVNFFLENINLTLKLFSVNSEISYLSIIIPVGISYYTFQALGYIIRINRGAEKAERNYFVFTVFLTFFPKFLAGPVERSNHFFPQLNNPKGFNTQNISAGLRLFLFGIFKKVVIGNNLAGPITLVYNDIHNYTGVPLLAVYFIQAIHLYCDFSGYTDMALGSAKILGIDLVDNFNRPFFAKSVGEFWRRWHISLSSWCNDFIFSPFIVKYRKMGNRAAIIGIYLTFIVIGIWHGASWTFVMVGLLQGVAISYEFYTRKKRLQIAARLPEKWVAFVSRILVYAFFSLTLIFFNAHSLQDAWYFISHLFIDVRLQLSGHKFILDPINFVFGMGMFVLLFISEVLKEKGTDVREFFISRPRFVRWAGYYVMILLVFYFSGREDTFVYLQF
jgi:D-alanyl-lipoteichoic acid acyltransferase DltB (MBOAT superfamily)